MYTSKKVNNFFLWINMNKRFTINKSTYIFPLAKLTISIFLSQYIMNESSKGKSCISSIGKIFKNKEYLINKTTNKIHFEISKN